jgi:putative heme-binding domain-containing protein
MEEGIPGTAMPAWKGRLSPQQIDSVIRYILSISHEIPEETNTPLAASAPSTPTVSAATEGQVARGKEQFFDLTKERNCAVCHRVHEAGLNVGPSLASLSHKSNSALLALILRPQAVQGVEVRTTSGETLCGIKTAEDSKALRVYDIPAAGPPVLRSFSPQDVVSRGHCDDLQPHAGVAGSYTRQQLFDIAAFLNSTQSAP